MAEEPVAMSIYQFLEKIDQEKKGYLLSVCANKNLRSEQALTTFYISYDGYTLS